MFFSCYSFERRCPTHPTPSWGSCASPSSRPCRHCNAPLCTWHLQVDSASTRDHLDRVNYLIEWPKQHRRLTHFEKYSDFHMFRKKKKKKNNLWTKAKISLLFSFPTCQPSMQKQGYMKVSLLFLLWFLYSAWLIASTAVLVEPNRLQPHSCQMTSDWWDATLLQGCVICFFSYYSFISLQLLPELAIQIWQEKAIINNFYY